MANVVWGTAAHLLGTPLLPLLERRLRRIVDEELAKRDLAEPSQVRDLSARLMALQEKINQLTTTAANLSARAATLPPAAVRARDALGTVALIGAQSELASLEQAAEQLRAHVQQAATNTVRAREDGRAATARTQAATDLATQALRAASEAQAGLERVRPRPASHSGCKVPGCEDKHRARGFCARHYQAFKRGLLPEFSGGSST